MILVEAKSSGRSKSLLLDTKKAEQMLDFFRGRPKTNNFEPTFTSLLHTLNTAWDTVAYEKVTAPIVAEIDEYESSNQIKGKIYAY